MASWAAFDEIRCISLSERDDRHAAASAEFAAAGVPVRFYRPRRSPHGGAYGCYESHYECVKEAYEAGKANVLIFEDDVVFRPGWETVVADCVKFVADGTERWDALFLGSTMYYPVAPSVKQPSAIWCAKCFCTHAYCVSRAGMESFLAHPPPAADPASVEHVDCFFMKLWANSYVCVNGSQIVVQSDSPTDNTKHEWLPAEYTDHFDYLTRRSRRPESAALLLINTIWCFPSSQALAVFPHPAQARGVLHLFASAAAPRRVRPRIYGEHRGQDDVHQDQPVHDALFDGLVPVLLLHLCPAAIWSRDVRQGGLLGLHPKQSGRGTKVPNEECWHPAQLR